jgi:hypothetical protein
MAPPWDPGNIFRPLDMSEIPGYPRQMLPEHTKSWLPKFSGNDETITEEHMSIFWAFFQFFPVDEDVEDLVMKLFAVTLHDDARIWFNGLPDKSIKSMANLKRSSSIGGALKKTLICSMT